MGLMPIACRRLAGDWQQLKMYLMVVVADTLEMGQLGIWELCLKERLQGGRLCCLQTGTRGCQLSTSLTRARV